jgi:large subunit ribosomal protein L21
MYAIIRTGGKQYKVSDGSTVIVEKLTAGEGETLEITDVLMIGDGDNVQIGTPTVEGAKVTATVVSTAKGKKIKGFTFKKVKNVQRHYGHRQWQTTLKIESIQS